MKKMTVKKYIVGAAKFLMIVVVVAFAGIRSLDFFTFVTKPEQWYLAYFGFGLTSGAVIYYLLVLMWDAETQLQKTIAILMLAVSVIGELLTAGFGIQVDAWKSGGFALTESDFSFMVLAIQVLLLFHALAMIAYYAGDKLAEAFGDDDGDGKPNYRDPDYKGSKRPQEAPRRDLGAGGMVSYAAETRRVSGDETPPTQGQG